MQRSVLNRAAIGAADTTVVSSGVTAESINDGLRAKKQSSRWRMRELTIFGSLLSLGVLANLPLLAVGLQLLYGSQSYAQQADLKVAAAAKAAAGREALSHAPANFPRPVGTFITFDAPGAGTGFFQGTFPSSISPAGAITGFYLDANSLGHGFLRASNGTFTTFDIPGAVNGIFPSSISPAGAITGYSVDVNLVGHGFLRATNGTLSPFDAPGAGTTPDFFQGTFAVGINPGGTIAGMYTDANNGAHGFLRASDGTFTTFDPPGSIAIFAPFSFGQNLYINPDGVITGTYFELISGNPFGGQFSCLCAKPRRQLHHI